MKSAEADVSVPDTTAGSEETTRVFWELTAKRNKVKVTVEHHPRKV